MRERPVLIVAHPGHELLVHDWMAEHGPMVMVLTDGSGSANAPRIADSLRIVTEIGAAPAPVFGHAPDSDFYAAILRGDAAFFAALVDAAAAAIVSSRAPVVLSDAIEHFNPVHDLAAVIATLAALIARREGLAAERWVFPIERAVDLSALPAGWRARRLDDAARARKRAALAGIPSLKVESDRRRVEGKEVSGVEVLGPLPARAPLMPDPEGEAFYETFGRARIAQGVYGELITYAGHVAPLARALRTKRAAAARAV
jgi:hypothetical protein